MTARWAVALTIVLLGGAGTAGAAPAAAPAAPTPTPAPPALFALVIGVNASPEAGIAPLQYADDDAARYLALFRALGARAIVLSRLDDNTRRLHPQAAAEVLPPRKTELQQAVDWLGRDVAQARARGVATMLYVVYAGHGKVRDEGGFFLTLEDGRMEGNELMTEIVDRIGAQQSHLIIDACHAYLLALPRGPGGTRHPARGFVELEARLRAGRVGYLLSSSMSGESHEWAGFEAGVFSHEVRSGLFLAWQMPTATAASPTRRSPLSFAARTRRSPPIASDRRCSRDRRLGDGLLVDLRPHRAHGIIIDGTELGAHHLIEDEHGVRLLDFHSAPGTTIQLLRPPGEGTLYARRISDGTERAIPRTDEPIRLAALTAEQPRVRDRGAAHQAFSRVFSLPFDAAVVASWQQESAAIEARFVATEERREADQRSLRIRRIAGGTLVGVGVASGVAAAAFALSARALRDEAPADENHRDATARNERIASLEPGRDRVGDRRDRGRSDWRDPVVSGRAGPRATGWRSRPGRFREGPRSARHGTSD